MSSEPPVHHEHGDRILGVDVDRLIANRHRRFDRVGEAGNLADQNQGVIGGVDGHYLHPAERGRVDAKPVVLRQGRDGTDVDADIAADQAVTPAAGVGHAIEREVAVMAHDADRVNLAPGIGEGLEGKRILLTLNLWTGSSGVSCRFSKTPECRPAGDSGPAALTPAGLVAWSHPRWAFPPSGSASCGKARRRDLGREGGRGEQQGREGGEDRDEVAGTWHLLPTDWTNRPTERNPAQWGEFRSGAPQRKAKGDLEHGAGRSRRERSSARWRATVACLPLIGLPCPINKCLGLLGAELGGGVARRPMNAGAGPARIEHPAGPDRLATTRSWSSSHQSARSFQIRFSTTSIASKGVPRSSSGRGDMVDAQPVSYLRTVAVVPVKQLEDHGRLAEGQGPPRSRRRHRPDQQARPSRHRWRAQPGHRPSP